MESIPFSEILKLNVSERIQLAEDIWDSIAAESGDLSITDTQRDELDRRLAALEKNGEKGASWEAVKARLLGDS